MQFVSLTKAARPRVVVALAALLMLPIGAAQPASGLVSVERLVGDCAASLEVVPLLTRLTFDERITAPIPTFLTGSTLTVHEATGTDARLRRTGPLGEGPLYSHWDSKVVATYEYDAFQVSLSDYFEESRISIRSDNPYWLTANSPNGFDMEARGPVTTTADVGDPRHPFLSEPASPLLAAAIDSLSFAGDLEILVEETAFKVHSTEGVDSYEANDNSALGSEADAEEVHYFVLEVRDARLSIGNTLLVADVFSQIANIRCTGSLLDHSEAVPSLIAQGDIRLSPRALSDETLSVPYTSSEIGSAGPQAANVGIATSAFPYWGLVVGFGVVAAGARAAWGFARRAPAPPSVAPTLVSPATENKPTPRTRVDLEKAYRADPGNAVLALELGLAYARDKQPHDALPLLQLAVSQYPKMDTARYFAGIALLEIGRVDEALVHLTYAFRLNALNVARFINEGAAHAHGHHPRVRVMLARWSRQFQESSSRGYA